MCAIAGILVEAGCPPVSEATLVNMRDSMRHRGPDGAGLWIDPLGRLGLAHRRLSVVDLSEASSQPMCDERETVRVVFNGEIYNHMALRRDLLAAGHRFRTEHSDTEVLIHGYKAWGWDGLLQRLHGMFAIGLWDATQRILFLARDRIGIKPLYLHSTDGRLFFASEIKAIVQMPGFARAIDPAAMYHYLSGMVAPAPMTMFRGVQKLPAGCYLHVDANGRMKFERYWHPALERRSQGPRSRGEAVQSLRSAFGTAVAENIGADVPVGVLLSGGVDSTSILAGMMARATTPVHTFSVGYDGVPELDERAQARDMADHFGAAHHEITVTQESFEQSWDDIVYHQDEPLADWVCLPLYHVAKLAAENVKVVLVGEGADELFAGYDSYLRYLRLHRLYWSPYQRYVPSSARGILGRIAQYAGRDSLSHSSGLEFFIRASLGKECFWGGAATFWEIQKSSLLRTDAIDFLGNEHETGLLNDAALRVPDSNAIMEQAAATLPSDTRDQLTRMLNIELAYRLPELLLMRVDKMTMAHSIEARVPFLDHRLVGAAFATSERWKLDGGRAKSLLKDAVRGLIPDRVIDRPKVGFGAPLASWLRGDFGYKVEHKIATCALFKSGWFNPAYISRMFEAHRSGRGNFGINLWALYNLASWYDRWIDGPVCSRS
jgi:asparagine synthase (glutamine-hydrolysing)